MSTGSARPSRTNHARSPGRSGRLTARLIQPLTGRQRIRRAGTIVASTRTTADASATDPADDRGSTEAASTARTSQAIPASIQRRYLERASQRFARAPRRAHHGPELLEHGGEDVERIGVVVDDQRADAGEVRHG